MIDFKDSHTKAQIIVEKSRDAIMKLQKTTGTKGSDKLREVKE